MTFQPGSPRSPSTVHSSGRLTVPPPDRAGGPADPGGWPAGGRSADRIRRGHAAPRRRRLRDGWIRLAHLSPNTPPVDVYLYSFGDPKAKTVLKHVAYGDVSPYMKVASGEYSVAMRAAGAKTGSPPVLSASVHIPPGAAYTVAGLGPAKALRLAYP